jgi:4'-phosphopantetheinyl transferase
MPGTTAWVEVASVARVLADAPERHEGWLSESERARLDGLRHPARRDQYRAGHWLARNVLARARGGVPVQWRLLERKGLPPAVHGYEAVRVSISHAGDWVAVAVAEVPIGIDLELRARVLDAALEPLLRNADEAPGTLDADALLQRWVAKEAWLKRAGVNALPEQLAGLRLQPASADQPQVCIDSHPELHVGLALETACVIDRRADVAMVEGRRYTVRTGR